MSFIVDNISSTSNNSNSNNLEIINQLINQQNTSEVLHRFEDIESLKSYNFELPTATQDKRLVNRVSWNTSTQFYETLISYYPVLKYANFENLALIGGSIVDILQGNSITNDLDFKTITKENLSCDDIIKTFIDRFYEALDNKNKELKEYEEKEKLKNALFKLSENYLFDLSKFRIKRMWNVWSIEIPKLSIPIQIIGTPYTSICKVFQEIDIGYTEVAFFENQLLFSDMGKFCFQNNCFIISNKTINNTEANNLRIIKYFNKGCDIIFPNLDMEKIPKRHLKFDRTEILDLPNLLIEFTEIKKNKILVRRIINICEINDVCDRYTRSNSDQLINVGKIIYQNIKNLAKGSPQDLISYGIGQQYFDVFNYLPILTDRTINQTYNSIKEKLLSKRSNFEEIEDEITVIDIDTIVKVLTVDIKEKITSTDKKFFNSKEYINYYNEYINELIDKQIEFVVNQFKNIKNNKNNDIFTFKIENRNTFVPPEDWYGEYYKNNFVN